MSLSDYVYKEFLGNPCALPDNLRNYQGTGKVKLHNDWPPILNKIPRSWNATGPRCAKDSAGYQAWPPKLEEGFAVCRWENGGASSIIEIPSLEGRWVRGFEVYGREWLAVERNPGHPDFNKSKMITIPFWQEAHVYDVKQPDGKIVTFASPNDYSPSTLQKFSQKGWVQFTNGFKSKWTIFKWRELPGLKKGILDPEEDTVWVTRSGSRPDHGDLYYNEDVAKPPNLSLRWN